MAQGAARGGGTQPAHGKDILRSDHEDIREGDTGEDMGEGDTNRVLDGPASGEKGSHGFHGSTQKVKCTLQRGTMYLAHAKSPTP